MEEKKEPLGRKESTPLVKGEPVDGEGKWKDDTCACFNGCGMCLTVLCCTSISIGQLYERTVQKGMLRRAFPGMSCSMLRLR